MTDRERIEELEHLLIVATTELQELRRQRDLTRDYVAQLAAVVR